MTRSRRARREAARERGRTSPSTPRAIRPVASEPKTESTRAAKKPVRSHAPQPWYQDVRIQQGVFVIVASLVVGGIGWFLYDQQQVAANPKPTPTISIPTPAPSATPGESPTAAANTTPTTRKTYTAPPAMGIDTAKSYMATLETSKGRIVAQLNAKDAPKTVNNFVFLARDGFYDGLTFHRVEDWVIQGGDPSGNGTGGPGYRFEDEPVVGDYTVGALAMANSGPNTNGSQFFFMKRDTPLPKQYNLFGRVTEGQSVINQIAIGDRITKVTISEN